jgi:hypothetical protein
MLDKKCVFKEGIVAYMKVKFGTEITRSFVKKKRYTHISHRIWKVYFITIRTKFVMRITSKKIPVQKLVRQDTDRLTD